MDEEKVISIFKLFSGEDDSEKYTLFIELAVAETKKMLADGADSSDTRLNFLSAAYANFRYQQANAARDRSESAYAGRLLVTQESSGVLKYAEKLLESYMSLCSDIIKPRTFLFMSFGSKEEADENAENCS